MKQLFKFSSSVYEKSLKGKLLKVLEDIKMEGTFKHERVLQSRQSTQVRAEGGEVLNFCSNNYLGLSSDPRVVDEAKRFLDSHGFGLSSVRFICGTQDIHKQLEHVISTFYQKHDAILYTSCFDANAGFFETIFDKNDCIISDALNHASIIDGIRLAKCTKHRLIVTDGVFSMDGDIAPLDKIVELGEKYDAMVFVDESHAGGFMGKTGKGTPELFGVEDKVDIITGTLGKGFGGASGGYTTANQQIIDVLRQKSRPYLFSNSLPPPIVGATLKVFHLLEQQPSIRQNLLDNTHHFRQAMTQLGFKVMGHQDCPIAPIYLADSHLAAQMSQHLLKQGIYVIPFSFPVVPKGQARIRVQLSSAHTPEQIDRAVAAFAKVGRDLKVIE